MTKDDIAKAKAEYGKAMTEKEPSVRVVLLAWWARAWSEKLLAEIGKR